MFATIKLLQNHCYDKMIGAEETRQTLAIRKYPYIILAIPELKVVPHVISDVFKMEPN